MQRGSTSRITGSNIITAGGDDAAAGIIRKRCELLHGNQGMENEPGTKISLGII